MQPVPSIVTKKYQKRGPLQQFRFAEATAFQCFRCGINKKAKLIAIYNDDWSRRICNGCYGRLLDLYEIKAGAKPDDERAEELAAYLLSAVDLHEQRQAELIFRTSENRAEHLSQEALKFIVTAEHVAKSLQAAPHLEWSPPIIGLCKAIELEILNRILKPLSKKAHGMDLGPDKEDKDIKRVAAFCIDPTCKPPELGVFAHFLQTVIHSRKRRGKSSLINIFLRIASDWVGSPWILDPDGLYCSLLVLITKFRNRAAHTDELEKEDYLSCREFTIGNKGILWKIIVSTMVHK